MPRRDRATHASGDTGENNEEERERAAIATSKRNTKRGTRRNNGRRPKHTRTKHEARTQREPPKKTRGPSKERRRTQQHTQSFYTQTGATPHSFPRKSFSKILELFYRKIKLIFYERIPQKTYDEVTWLQEKQQIM